MFAVAINFLLFVIISQFKLKDIRVRFLLSILTGFIFILISFKIIKNYEFFIIHLIAYFALSFVIWNIYMLSATAQRIKF